ncbi:hypothetical protein PCANC_15261 [Puccinia coronata f. sp. avenae]|uniref:Uncharacterized protein n=1 Tax=Puccinia coronata f. sp. avenae TaxID=200324 RepID=A0A2N5UII7_9BASI|nr:hypothetical protein PCANC_15261 [Puccinia coronata f. sp. avenae]
MAPKLFFNSQLNFPVADSKGYPNSLANKNGCWGCSIVVDKTEVPVSVPGGNSYKNLIVTLKHSDYDNNAKDIVEFKAVLVSISSGNEKLKNALPVASSSAARLGRGDKESIPLPATTYSPIMLPQNV